MASSDMFREIFKGVSLEIEDLYLLESFQIGYFRDLVPEKECAAVLHAYPSIRRFLVRKCSDITDYIERVLAQHSPASDEKELAACIDKIVWTVADLIVYNKCPEAYDSLEFHNWDFREITLITPLEDKVVIDCGAGTGRITLEAARTAGLVYAIEPVGRLRQFIREKAAGSYLKNVYVMDGFLHSIPLPDSFADVLITSHALGWQLQEELWEFERVTKKGGFIIHCPGTAKVPPEEHVHHRLISPDWGYEYAEYQESDGWKRKYWKQL